MTVDAKIQRLRNGESIRISGTDECFVMAERSGDGKTLRIVRCTAGGFETIKTMQF